MKISKIQRSVSANSFNTMISFCAELEIDHLEELIKGSDSDDATDSYIGKCVRLALEADMRERMEGKRET